MIFSASRCKASIPLPRLPLCRSAPLALRSIRNVKLAPRSLVVVLFMATWISCDALGAGGTLYPSDPRCEYLKNPLGIDPPKPRLSWKLQSLISRITRNQDAVSWGLLHHGH